MIRISAIEPSMIVVTASRVNETSSPEPSVTRAPSVSSAVLPCSATSTSIPLSSSQSCRSESSALASSTMPGTLSENRDDLVADRVGEDGHDAGDAPRSAPRKTHSTATPRGNARALQHHHERVEQQRDERGDDEDQRDRARPP